MTIKIKKFKGSLNPIFGEDITHEVQAELNTSKNEKAEIEKDHLLINCIKPRSDQPRKIFNESSLEELTQSIHSKGVIQPIIVRRINEESYEIIVGERRWRAAKRAGLEKIPAIIRDYDKSERIAIALIENIQREDLNPLEEAETLQSLIEEYAMTHSQLAESIGRSRVTVSNLLRLLDLTQEVKSMVHAGLLDMGHARALLSLNGEQQIEAAKLIIGKCLSVRETERLIQNINREQEKPIVFIDSELKEKVLAWRASLSNQLLSKVKVHFDPEGQGRVVIHFNSLEKVNWLMDHIKIEE